MNNINRFSDVREFKRNKSNNVKIITSDKSTIESLMFNEKTLFSNDSQKIAKEILEKGKNPGLSIKKIHSEGITGKGVNIAIIDQPLINHPEYEGKIINYLNIDEEGYEGQSSMHGPAVLSLFCGQNIGVAPDAKVLYVAAPSWKYDFSYYEKAIAWIIEQNNLLSEKDKIKLISFSGAPAYIASNNNSDTYNYYLEKWKEIQTNALEKGILIICCSQTMYNIKGGYYDINDPDNIQAITTRFPNPRNNSEEVKPNTLIVPSACRTIAEIYDEGDPSYCYDGLGGLSWGIPYLCGCLALAMQINPSLSAKQLMDIVLQTAYKKNEYFVLDPLNFIQTIKRDYSSNTIDSNKIK